MECLQVAGLTALLGLQSSIVSCQQTAAPTPQVSVLELDVLGFRVWMIIGFVGIGFLIIIIVLCCVFDCRIPRTKQQIEQDQERRELIAKYKQKVKAMQYKKSKYTQARQRAAMMIGDWNMEDGETGTGTGTDAMPSSSTTADPVPLAQHPAAMLTGSQEGGSNVSNKPLVMIPLIPGPPAIQFPNKMAFMRYYGFKTRKRRDGQNAGFNGPCRRAAQHGRMRGEHLLQGRSRRHGEAQGVNKSMRPLSSRERNRSTGTSHMYRKYPAPPKYIELDWNRYRGRCFRETTA